MKTLWGKIFTAPQLMMPKNKKESNREKELLGMNLRYVVRFIRRSIRKGGTNGQASAIPDKVKG